MKIVYISLRFFLSCFLFCLALCFSPIDIWLLQLLNWIPRKNSLGLKIIENRAPWNKYNWKITAHRWSSDGFRWFHVYNRNLSKNYSPFSHTLQFAKFKRNALFIDLCDNFDSLVENKWTCCLSLTKLKWLNEHCALVDTRRIWWTLKDQVDPTSAQPYAKRK